MKKESRRGFWKGELKMALVTCPVRLDPVIEPRAAIHFHWLNPKTHRRINMVPVDPIEGELSRDQLVKAYEYRKGKYVVMADKDFEKARVESTHTISLDRFVPTEEIDSIYRDTPYYIVPDGKGANEVYQVIRAALAAEGCSGIGYVVIGQRERLVEIKPMEEGLLLTTLHSPGEVRSSRDYFGALKAGKIDRDLVDIARKIMRGKRGKFKATQYKDHYEETLRKVIAAKVKGRTYKVAAPAARRGRVISLGEALKKSLGSPPKKTKQQAAKKKRRAA
jgi:DNA end-binding protein Ku